jgi:hypothetical protein
MDRIFDKTVFKMKVHFIMMQLLFGIYESTIAGFCITDLCKLKISKFDAHHVTGCGSNSGRSRNYFIAMQPEGPCS